MANKQFDNEEINKIIKDYKQYKAVIKMLLFGIIILFFITLPQNVYFIFSELASYYVSKGNYIKAENMHKQAIKVIRKIGWKNSWLTICSMENLAILYVKQGKLKEAENIYDKAIEIRGKAKKSANDFYIANLLNKKGYVQEMQGKHKEAQYCLNKASLLRKNDYLRYLR